MQKEGKMGRWPAGITYQLLAVRAQSKGSVRLQAADMTQRPAIDLAYLSDKAGACPLPAAASINPTCTRAVQEHVLRRDQWGESSPIARSHLCVCYLALYCVCCR